MVIAAPKVLAMIAVVTVTIRNHTDSALGGLVQSMGAHHHEGLLGHLPSPIFLLEVEAPSSWLQRRK